MNSDFSEHANGPGAPAELLPNIEAALLSAWRRVIEEGGGPELTLEEASALLGSSADGLRRSIRGGQIRAYKDSKGRIRVNASVTYAPEFEPLSGDAAATGETVSRALTDLRQAREELVQLQETNRGLREELDAAEAALEYTKSEVANLWQVITSRNEPRARADDSTNPASRLSVERQRIQGKISNMRDIARRRRFPWSMAG
ncbi:MAG TPA: hypothetical protein VFY10_08890 [Dehalococcoidia bacterium]|nr:hypothetical protein [Dehalococcoidia bacterium]